MLTNTTNDVHKHDIPYVDEQYITWAMSTNIGTTPSRWHRKEDASKGKELTNDGQLFC